MIKWIKNFQRISITIAALLIPVLVSAQDIWPSRSVRVVVSFGVGGATDNLVRAFAKELSDALGQSFVVDNRGGAAGSLGTDIAAKAKADGYTLLFGPANPLTIVPHLRKTPYAIDDLIPVARLGTYIAGLVVRNSLPVQNMQEFIALAKSKPGQITFGSSGNGSMAHIRIEALKQAASVDVLHVPYSGGPAEMQDILGERLDAMTENIIFPQVKSGRMRMLAILGDQRHPDFPYIPTAKEVGYPEINTPGTFAVFAPKGTPQAIILKINSQVIRIAQTQSMRDRMMGIGFSMGNDTPQEIKTAVNEEYEIYGKIIRAANIKDEN